MRTLMLLVAGVSLAAIGGDGVHAQNRPPAGQHMTYGPGIESCGAWIANHPNGQTTKANPYATYAETSWVYGFVSGVGFSGHSMRVTDSLALEAFVDNYCHANPLKDIADAAAALVAELQKP